MAATIPTRPQLAENVPPPYYGTVDTKVKNPGNTVLVANTNENWSIGDFLGLDNDGNNLYDAADFAITPYQVLSVESRRATMFASPGKPRAGEKMRCRHPVSWRVLLERERDPRHSRRRRRHDELSRYRGPDQLQQPILPGDVRAVTRPSRPRPEVSGSQAATYKLAPPIILASA